MPCQKKIDVMTLYEICKWFIIEVLCKLKQLYIHSEKIEGCYLLRKYDKFLKKKKNSPKFIEESFHQAFVKQNISFVSQQMKIYIMHLQ